MRRLALLISLVLGMGMLSAPPAAAWEPPGGAVFNIPPPWGTQDQNYRIIKHVEAAIAGVPNDPDWGTDAPEILVTTYLLDRKKSIDGLIQACKEGASVRVIIDKGIETDGSIRLAKALNGDNRTKNADGTWSAPQGPSCDGRTDSSLTDREAVASITEPLPNDTAWGRDRSYLTQCEGSCRGGRGSMHTKFYAFSQTGDASHVVMVSSSNLNKGGATKGWNDLYTMKRVPLTYEAYEKVHDEMGEDKNLTKSDREVREKAANGATYTSRFFPMENGTRSNDPTLQDLNNVRCQGSVFGRTRVSINMFYWQGVRGEYLLDKVLAMAKDGCVVNIIIGAPSLNIAKRLRAASRARLVKVWDSRHWTKNRVLKVRTHNKYVAIKGTYDNEGDGDLTGDKSAHLVMTGSQNWGHGSLDKSDDSTLNIEYAPAYGEYLRQWGMVKNRSIRMAPPR